MKDFSQEKHCEAINKLFSMFGSTKIINQEQKNAYMDANLIDLDFDTPVYRIFSLDRFLSMLKDKQLCLVKPRLWDDPFENFLMNAEGVLDDGRPVSFEPVRERYYGQCWSLKEECDGLWRNYTNYYSCQKCTESDFTKRHGKKPISVKVRSTVGKLMDAFYDEKAEFHSLSYFIGKVRYLELDEIIDYLKMENVTDTTNIGQVLSLMIKRKSFAYEEEVRLIYSSPDNGYGKSKSDIHLFSINPDIVFEEVELDPWVDNKDCQITIDQIKQFYHGQVTKSKLYDHPFFKVKL